MNKLISIFSSIQQTARMAFAATLTVALLTSTTASADVSAITVTLGGPTAVAAGAGVVYTVDYSLTATDVTSAVITVALPVGYAHGSAIAPTGVTTTCTGNPVICVIDLNFTNGGVAGAATISGSLAVGSQLDGATMNALATFDVDYTGGPATVTSTDGQDTVVSADAAPLLSTLNIQNARWIINPSPVGGQNPVGLSWEYKIRANNNGNAYLDAGWRVTNDIDDQLTFVAWTPLSNSGYSEVSGPAAWTKNPSNLVIESDQQLTGTAREALVQVWISCDDLALVAGALTNQLDLSGTEQKFAGSVTVTQSSTYTGMPDAALGGCGTGGTAGKSSNPPSTIGEGENVTWSLGVSPPNGAVEITDAFVVDRIPTDTTFVSASVGAPTDFTRYYCVVPAETGNFTVAQFLATYQSSGCSTSPPGTLSTVTHVVWYAPTWGDAAVGIGSFSASLVTAVPIGVFAHDDVVTNTARAEGEFPFNGTSTFLFEPTDDVAVRTDASADIAVAQWPYYLNNQPKVGGQELTLFAFVGSDWGLARVRNPTVTMNIPAGLIFIESLTPTFVGNPSSNSCSWDGPLPDVYSDPATSQTLGDGSTELTWTFGSGAQPTLMGFDCTSLNGGSGSVGWAPLWVSARVRVDPFAGLTNGQLLPFSATVNGENMTTPKSAQRNVVIAVPAEMRTDVQPDCTDDTTPLPSLLVRYENSGGEELTDVYVTVAIPKIGDGSGTQVDTMFVRWENVPAAGTMQYELNASGSYVAGVPAGGDLAAVTSVRLFQTPLAPLGGPQTFNVVISVPGGTATGTFIRGSSLMAATPLPTLASANSAPIKVNLCPGILAVHVFFDANDNGVQDAGEPDLPNYDVVTVDTTDASVVLNWTTDATGDYSQQLSPATYEMTVTHPTAGTGATWTSSPVQATVVTNQTAQAIIPVTCTCASEDTCVTSTCNEFGICIADDAFVASDTTCGVGACAATGTTTCVNGVPGDDCTPGTASTDPDLCDGVDNDCDDAIDEDYVVTDTSCGVGVCENAGELVCTDGVEVDDCVDGNPNPAGEQCNGLDDDCDGQIDIAAGGTNACGELPPDGIPITTPTGGVLCGEYALNAEEGYVSTGYTNVNEQVRFCHQFDGTDATTPFPAAPQCVYP
ncbi:MAG: hypothetical protein ACI9MR_000392 [Myxococcota bacterium]|jgi:hypothetical protein